MSGHVASARRSPPIPEEDRSRLRVASAAQYRGGESIRSIADCLGYSYGTVRNLLLEAGVTLRPNTKDQLFGRERTAVRADVVARHAAGASVSEIARTVGRSTYLVRALLDEAGIARGTLRVGRRGITIAERQALREQFVALHRAGADVRAIAQATRRSPKIIMELLDEAGVARRRLRQITAKERPQVRAAAAVRYRGGESIDNIAAALGYSRSTVFNLLHEAREPLRPPVARRHTANRSSPHSGHTSIADAEGGDHG